MTLSLPDFLYSQLERASCRDGDHPCGKRSFVWRGHGIVVCGASAHRCSEGICRLGASGRRDRFNSFCDYGGKNLLGRAGTANSSPLPFFAYPFLVLAFVGWIWTLLKTAEKNHLRAHEICLTA